jgi:hypothetical protein
LDAEAKEFDRRHGGSHFGWHGGSYGSHRLMQSNFDNSKVSYFECKKVLFLGKKIFSLLNTVHETSFNPTYSSDHYPIPSPSRTSKINEQKKFKSIPTKYHFDLA